MSVEEKELIRELEETVADLEATVEGLQEVQARILSPNPSLAYKATARAEGEARSKEAIGKIKKSKERRNKARMLLRPNPNHSYTRHMVGKKPIGDA